MQLQLALYCHLICQNSCSEVNVSLLHYYSHHGTQLHPGLILGAGEVIPYSYVKTVTDIKMASVLNAVNVVLNKLFVSI